ncbi:MAG: carboxylating nicotinate-nucleotide diphosphorylase [Desulfobacteraceae bacterium]|nr:carboxylating nicotinate-nucleotide diphosphorylase [Desulfobacteraceae bacterium]
MNNSHTAHLIETALKEDIGPGDITTDNLIAPDAQGKGTIIAKEALVIAGLDIAKQVFETLDSEIIFKPGYKDGDYIEKGETVARVEGRLRSLLIGERTALNFLQRLSGIATHVRSYVKVLENKTVRLVDTRKTTPGWRVLEKYAVRVGGAYNHRMGLFDGVLIKDNHIAAFGGIAKSIECIRNNVSHLVKTEVEVSSLEQVKEAVNAGADVIMLDNMDIPRIKQAVSLIKGKAVVEVSGGITKENLALLADTGVDIISVGALTHSARCVDLSMAIS